jgi:hypothetical protein
MKRTNESRFPLPLNFIQNDQEDKVNGPPRLVHDVGSWEGFEALKDLVVRETLFLQTEKVDAVHLELQNCSLMPSHLFAEVMVDLARRRWLGRLELSLTDWDEARWEALIRLVHEGSLQTLALGVPSATNDVVAEKQLLDTLAAGCESRHILLERSAAVEAFDQVTGPRRDALAGSIPDLAPSTGRLAVLEGKVAEFIDRVQHQRSGALDLCQATFHAACHVLAACPFVVRARLQVGDGAAPDVPPNVFENLRVLCLTVDGWLSDEQRVLQTLLRGATRLKALNVKTRDQLHCDAMGHLATMLAGASNLDQIRLTGSVETSLNPYVVRKFDPVLLRNPTLTKFVCRLFTGSDALSLLHALANPKTLPLLEELDLSIVTVDADRKPAVRDALCRLVTSRRLAALTLRNVPVDQVGDDACEQLFRAVKASRSLTRFTLVSGVPAAKFWGSLRAEKLESRLILNNPDLLRSLVVGLQFGPMDATPDDIRDTIARQIRRLCTGVELQRVAAGLMLVCRRAALAAAAHQAACLSEVLQLLEKPTDETLRQAVRRVRSMNRSKWLRVAVREALSMRLGESRRQVQNSPAMTRKLEKLEALVCAR